ncbi:MAG: PhoU domain-containing protein, partial [Clostridia bacterium]|nr:PhoU domain-containing protein [Clostridia bacterium]
MRAAVYEILRLAEGAFKKNDADLASDIEPLEQVVDDLKSTIKLHHTIRLSKSLCSIELGFILSDLLTNFERVSDHCSNIAGCLIEMSSHESLDLHSYLAKVKKGGKEYDKLYKQYSEKYSLPEA